MSLKEFKNKLNTLKRYNTFQEKEALIACMDEERTYRKVLEKLGYNAKSEYEAIAIIFKLREISVGDIIDVTFQCKHCNKNVFYNISIPKMFFNSEIDESVPVGIYEDIYNIEDIDKYLSEENIDFFDNFREKIFKNNKAIFNNIVDLKCSSCGHKERRIIDAFDIISNFTIKDIYEQYINITYYTNMNKNDIDNCWPFEREIFIGLINKKEEEKSNGK